MAQKVEMRFYIDAAEAEQVREHADDYDMSVSEYIRQQLAESQGDGVAAFIENRIRHDLTGWETNADIFDEYLTFCRQQNRTPIESQRVFGKRFADEIDGWADVYDKRRVVDGSQQRGKQGVEIIPKWDREGGL